MAWFRLRGSFALLAAAMGFNRLIGDHKPILLGLAFKGIVDGLIMQFNDQATLVADQQLHGMMLVKMLAK